MAENNGSEAYERQLIRMEAMVSNVMATRAELLRGMFDTRVDIDNEARYPTTFTAAMFQDMYDREAIAARVVELWPRESWQLKPWVYEDERPEISTEFEKAWDDLGRQLRGEASVYKDTSGLVIWDYLERLDILSGVGSFGIMLLGLDDGKPLSEPAEPVGDREDKDDLEEPEKKPTANDAFRDWMAAQAAGPTEAQADMFAPAAEADLFAAPAETAAAEPLATPEEELAAKIGKVEEGLGKWKPQKKLLFLRCFPETMVQIIEYEKSLDSRRFGEPLYYSITLTDPRLLGEGSAGQSLTTSKVHWTRVIHVADNLSTSEVFGVPRMKPVFRRIWDLQKLYAGSAEMYWRGAFPGLSIETHPQLGGDVDVDAKGLRNMVTDYTNSLQRNLALVGMSAKSLETQVVDPTPQVDVQITAICVRLAIPKRIFAGSERGELGSSQDRSEWNDRLNARRESHLTPRLVAPFIDRLIWLGVLPKPKEYKIIWPKPGALTEQEKAAVAVQRTTALAQYISSGADAVVPPAQYLTGFQGMEDEDAQSTLGAAADQAAAPGADLFGAAAEEGFGGDDLGLGDEAVAGASPDAAAGKSKVSLADKIGGWDKLRGLLKDVKAKKETKALSAELLKLFFDMDEAAAAALIQAALKTVEEEEEEESGKAAEPADDDDKTSWFAEG